MTGQAVFDLAIRLMDEQNEGTGSTNTVDTREYQLRSVDLLNTLGQECYYLSDTCQDPPVGKRAVFPKIVTLSEELDLDDYVAGVVIPYGLVYLLAQTEESGALANTCLQRYQELKAEARRMMAATTFAPIEDVYGALEHGQFSSW